MIDKKLRDNPHMKRSLMQIGLLKGEAGELHKKIRRRDISDKEIKECVKEDWEKTLKAFNEIYLSDEQIELIIKGLEENLEHFKNLEVHKKEHPKGEPCFICSEYRKIIKSLKEKEHKKSNRLTKEQIIEINKSLGIEFKTEFGLGGNKSNLDYALTLKDPYQISKEILRGHPFVDCNKRTAFMVYMLLTTKKNYEEILKDYYDILRGLAR